MIQGTLGVLNLNDIDMGVRGRTDYKDLTALAQNIKEHGLIHPIAVCPHPMGTGYLLIAGGRRMKAHILLGAETVECKIFPEGLTELEIRAIELAENIFREDLEYHEKIKMERDIRDLMVKIYGKKTSTAQDAPGISDRDVAKMLGITPAKLSQDLALVKTIETFPEIPWEKCKNQSDAVKLKENISKTLVRHEAVKRFDKTMQETKGESASVTIKRKLAQSYLVGDFFELVKQIPDNSMHLVELDPPYAIELDKIKKRTGFGGFSYGEQGYNEVDVADYDSFLRQTFQECFRVMAKDSFLICWFASDPWFPVVVNLLQETGFIVRALPCVWVKGETDEVTEELTGLRGQTQTPMRHLGSAYEMFFYAKKGDPKINKMGRTNVFSFKPQGKKIHPTERPVELISEILTTFTLEGSRVLVPFAGSGNTLLAAFQNKMTAIGFDLGVIHKEAYLSRLEELFPEPTTV